MAGRGETDRRIIQLGIRSIHRREEELYPWEPLAALCASFVLLAELAKYRARRIDSMWLSPQERLRLLCERAGAVGNDRYRVWRDMRLELAVFANPISLVAHSEAYPANLDTEYFPQGQIQVGGLLIDDIPIQPGQFDPLYRGQLALLIANPADENAQRWAHAYDVQAGWEAFQAANYQIALRFWVNSLRLQATDGQDYLIRTNFALCLQELGHRDNAATCYLTAAEGAEREGKGLEAADWFERAGLAWETQLPCEGDRRSLQTDSGFYNSTVCFRKAKYLYANAGESEGASRCSVLERETEHKWATDQRRRTALTISRYLWLHGESYLYVVRAIAATVVAFAIGYCLSGYRVDGKCAQATDFLDALYLSVITLATVGYGDLTPSPGWSRLLAGVEGLTGIILMAMLLVTFQRRYAGR